MLKGSLEKERSGVKRMLGEYCNSASNLIIRTYAGDTSRRMRIHVNKIVFVL